MPRYIPPIRDMAFLITELGGLTAFAGEEPLSLDRVIAVLAEAGMLGSQVIAPLNPLGDRLGCQLEEGRVRTPQGFRAAYAHFVEGGWPALPFPPEHGGQDLPWLVTAAVGEIWSAANLAFALGPLLTQAAARLIERHGSAELRETYFGNLASGLWTAALSLTEAQAGSDLSAIRCRAVAEGEHWRITGQKLHVAWGDHDLSENIIHLVLARSPKGLSLFLVPKTMPDGRRNEVHCQSLAQTMGLHGCPVASMGFGEELGAAGWLVGAEGEGLSVAFSMLTLGRLLVGLQGVGVAERAYQKARDHARERRQGRPIGKPDAPPVTLIHHPDIQRMLLSMKTETEAARALGYCAARALDLAENADTPDLRAAARARAALLTPVVKAWGSEVGGRVTDLALQVQGAAGYLEETGMSQHLRDVRATAICEGTLGMQALDLVHRQLPAGDGAAIRALLAEMRETEASLADWPRSSPLGRLRPRLRDAIGDLETATTWLRAHGADQTTTAAAATPTLRLLAIVTGGWRMCKAAIAAVRALAAGAEDVSTLEAKLVTARFYADNLLPQSTALLIALRSAGQAVGALSEDQF